MDQIKIKAERRTEQGTGAVRRLRRTGQIPGSVMKMGKGGTELVKFSAHEFMLAMRGHASKQMLVTLDLEGKDLHALMREHRYILPRPEEPVLPPMEDLLGPLGEQLTRLYSDAQAQTNYIS